MKTFSALLAICAGISPVPDEFLTQRPVTRSFDVLFDLRPNKRLSKKSWGLWFETPSRPLWRHRNGACRLEDISGAPLLIPLTLVKSLQPIRRLTHIKAEKNGRHFADYIFKCIFLNENVWISLKISLKCVPEVRINNIPALVQIMAWRRPGDKSLSEPMMVSLLAHTCVTRPQWVKQTWMKSKGVLSSFELQWLGPLIYQYMRQWTNHHWLRKWLVAWPTPTHYLDQCWDIVNWTLRNKLQWNLNRNSHIFIQENAFENVVCEMAAILSRPRCWRFSRPAMANQATCPTES